MELLHHEWNGYRMYIMKLLQDVYNGMITGCMEWNGCKTYIMGWLQDV